MKKFIILIPIYNDWKSVFQLLENIDLQIAKWDAEVLVLIINDGSTEERTVTELSFKNIKTVRVMNMKQNQGHARCNAAGLKYLTEKEDFDYVILMDGDGEDRPEELTSLFNKSKENPLKTVTANRIKRSEGSFFKLLYECHKILTYVFTGKLIKFGNYSCLPKEDAARLDIFRVFFPSPPVPQVSIMSSDVFTFNAFSLKTYTPPAISSDVSPLADKFVKNL